MRKTKIICTLGPSTDNEEVFGLACQSCEHFGAHDFVASVFLVVFDGPSVGRRKEHDIGLADHLCEVVEEISSFLHIVEHEQGCGTLRSFVHRHVGDGCKCEGSRGSYESADVNSLWRAIIEECSERFQLWVFSPVVK